MMMTNPAGNPDTISTATNTPIGWCLIDRGHAPWNWRVLIGPWAYLPWLQRTRR